MGKLPPGSENHRGLGGWVGGWEPCNPLVGWPSCFFLAFGVET